MTTSQTIKDIEKGCGEPIGKYKDFFCGRRCMPNSPLRANLCPICQATLKATKETAEQVKKEVLEELENIFIGEWDFMKKANVDAYIHIRRVLEIIHKQKIQALNKSPNKSETPTLFGDNSGVFHKQVQTGSDNIQNKQEETK